jgi:hypothetical protein
MERLWNAECVETIHASALLQNPVPELQSPVACQAPGFGAATKKKMYSSSFLAQFSLCGSCPRRALRMSFVHRNFRNFLFGVDALVQSLR